MKVRVRTSSLVRWGVTIAFAANLVLIAFALIARAEGDPKNDTKTPTAATAADSAADADVPQGDLEQHAEDRLLQEIRDLADEVRREKERLVATRDEAERLNRPDKDSVPAAAAATPAAAGGAAAPPAAATPSSATANDPFARLIAAFENMEPETSAAALLPLYEKDREAALRVLLEVSTRKAGALMDALATISPETAAAIAVDIHSRSPRQKDPLNRQKGTGDGGR